MIFLTKVGSTLLLQSNTLNPSLIILPYADHCCLLHVDRLQQQGTAQGGSSAESWSCYCPGMWTFSTGDHPAHWSVARLSSPPLLASSQELYKVTELEELKELIALHLSTTLQFISCFHILHSLNVTWKEHWMGLLEEWGLHFWFCHSCTSLYHKLKGQIRSFPSGYSFSKQSIILTFKLPMRTDGLYCPQLTDKETKTKEWEMTC